MLQSAPVLLWTNRGGITFIHLENTVDYCLFNNGYTSQRKNTYSNRFMFSNEKRVVDITQSKLDHLTGDTYNAVAFCMMLMMKLLQTMASSCKCTSVP